MGESLLYYEIDNAKHYFDHDNGKLYSSHELLYILFRIILGLLTKFINFGY